MAEQMRAFRGPRKVRIPKEAKAEVEAFQAKVTDIRRHEEKLKLIKVLRDRRNEPLIAARARVERAQAEFDAAHAALVNTSSADTTDLDEQEANIQMIIDRLKEEAAMMVAKAQSKTPS
jgi:hypothetical protein